MPGGGASGAGGEGHLRGGEGGMTCRGALAAGGHLVPGVSGCRAGWCLGAGWLSCTLRPQWSEATTAPHARSVRFPHIKGQRTGHTVRFSRCGATPASRTRSEPLGVGWMRKTLSACRGSLGVKIPTLPFRAEPRTCDRTRVGGGVIVHVMRGGSVPRRYCAGSGYRRRGGCQMSDSSSIPASNGTSSMMFPAAASAQFFTACRKYARFSSTPMARRPLRIAP